MRRVSASIFVIRGCLLYSHGRFLPGILRSATWSVGMLAWGVMSIADVCRSSFWAGAPGMLRMVPILYMGWLWGIELTFTMVEGRLMAPSTPVGTTEPASAMSPLDCVSCGDALFTLSAALFLTILWTDRISHWKNYPEICDGCTHQNQGNLFDSWDTQDDSWLDFRIQGVKPSMFKVSAETTVNTDHWRHRMSIPTCGHDLSRWLAAQLTVYLLMDDTLGTFSWSQTPSDSSLSLISHANKVMFSRL